MEILLYQIGIFFAIQIASLFGKSSRNVAVVLISIFTILQVFTSWLMLIQFITILVSYNISERRFQNLKIETSKKSSKVILKSYDKNGGRIYQEFDESDNLSPEIKKRIESQKEIQRLSKNQYENDPEMKKAVDDVLASMFNQNKK